MSQHTHTNRNNNPDVIDKDGDHWSWTDSDINGEEGYRLVKRANPERFAASPDEVSAHSLDYLRNVWGPIKEIPVTTSVFKLPEIPADVVKLKVVGSNKTFERSGSYWIVRDDNWGDCSYTLAEVLGDHPEGVEPIVKTELDKAVEYFGDRRGELDTILSWSGQARNHAAAILKAYLDNHAG